MAGKVGRPKRAEAVTPILLRIPPAILARVERNKARIELRDGASLSRTEAFWRILEAGCDVLEGASTRVTPGAPAHLSIAEISKISEISDEMPGYGFPEDMDEETPTSSTGSASVGEQASAHLVPVPQASKAPSAASALGRERAPIGETLPPRSQRGLSPEKLQEIADERTRCAGLSLRDFAQRLFDRHLYRTTAKDGNEVPVKTGTLKKWLDQARDAGLL